MMKSSRGNPSMKTQNHTPEGRLGCTTKTLLSITLPIQGTTHEKAREKYSELCESFFEREGSRLPVTITDEEGCVLYTSDPDFM